MIVISNNYILSVLNAVEAKDKDLLNPVIGYHNIVSVNNLEATGEQALYPLANLLTEATNLIWKADDIGTHYLTVTTNSADDYDYVGIANHNFGSAGIVASVEVYDGTVWNEVVQPTIFADDDPVIFRYTPQGGAGVRLKMLPGSAPPEVAVLYVGKLLVLQRRIYVGHTPITYGRDAEVLTGKSETGHFLGRIVTKETLSTSFAIQNMTPDWYREYLDPFIEHAIEYPFFFAWRPQKYPREVGFCWIMGDTPKPSNQRPNGMMQISIQVGGLKLR